MPDPLDDESHDDFIERCIPIVLDEGTASDSDQAVAICNSLWEEDKKSMAFDTVIIGGTVKALGDGRVGGLLVRYGADDDRDRVGDYFHKDTDYGDHKTTPVYYMHGLDRTLKARILADGATLEEKDLGIWIEAQLKLRDAYERYIHEQIELGKMGWSSGTPIPSGLRMGEGFRIDRWHLGVDASILPIPAEPRNAVITLKSLSSYPTLQTLIDAPEVPIGTISNKHIQLRARAHLALD
jgi:hypothetical protein